MTSGVTFNNNASIDALRGAASRDPKAAIKEAAKQFEALFMQELMKSMRAGTLGEGWLDNAGSKMGAEMLDDQFAAKMTGMPGGLSEAIAKQLERQLGGGAAAAVPPAAAANAPVRTSRVGSGGSGAAKDFVTEHQQAAKAAEADTGIPAAYILGQAAHESGWGRREIRHRDGSNSFNLFGIKAGAHWKGDVAEVTTTEYVNGQPRKVTAKFRAYESYEAAFRDYAKLLKDSPRYANVVAQGNTAQGFAQGLQKAGYATDPAYADKLSRVINTTLRLQRTVVA
jgi:flagellar protein FlgJ